jgi:hypothetical protein
VPDHASQACAYLRMLLLRPGDYRARWEKQAPATQPGELCYPAIAAVLKELGPVVDAERQVAVALDGQAITAAQVDLFVDAFGIRARHAHRLRELLRGSPAVRVLAGEAAAEDLDLAGRTPGHETLSLHELHTVGADGRPAEHETIQVIKSTVDGLSSYPYRFDTDELMVEVVRGGRVGDRLYRINNYLYGIDILLDRPLAVGENALLHFHTTFAYRSDPPPELRRGVLRMVNDLTIWVRFHPDRVPTRVWQARWDRLDQARVVEQQEAEIDHELSVHARFGPVESAIVGFWWEWD